MTLKRGMSTAKLHSYYLKNYSLSAIVICTDVCGHGLVVECDLAKVETGVRFSLPAQIHKRLAIWLVFCVFVRAKMCPMALLRENRSRSPIFMRNFVPSKSETGTATVSREIPGPQQMQNKTTSVRRGFVLRFFGTGFEHGDGVGEQGRSPWRKAVSPRTSENRGFPRRSESSSE